MAYSEVIPTELKSDLLWCNVVLWEEVAPPTPRNCSLGTALPPPFLTPGTLTAEVDFSAASHILKLFRY